jgi:LysR family glycine cleavage system transcriptional activator
MPTGRVVQEICRDTFFPVCSPALLTRDGNPIVRAADLLRFPLIHYDWMTRDPQAPTWRQWLATAGLIDPSLTAIDKPWALSFREELHAIDAVMAGQGIAICSSVVVGHELKSGTLVQAHPLSLPGYGFYLVALPQNVRQVDIEAFATWVGKAD